MNFLDLTFIRAAILNLETRDDPSFPQTQDFINAGDVNGDGFTNFLDMTFLRAVILGFLLPLPNNLLIYFEALPNEQIKIAGIPGSVSPNAVIRITNKRTGVFHDITADAVGSFQITWNSSKGDIITLNQRKTERDAPGPLIVRFRIEL